MGWLLLPFHSRHHKEQGGIPGKALGELGSTHPTSGDISTAHILEDKRDRHLEWDLGQERNFRRLQCTVVLEMSG